MIINIFDRIVESNGHINSLVGILVVFIGLIMISVTISLFNKASHFFQNKDAVKDVKVKEDSLESKKTDTKEIPEDELVAIATAY